MIRFIYCAISVLDAEARRFNKVVAVVTAEDEADARIKISEKHKIPIRDIEESCITETLRSGIKYTRAIYNPEYYDEHL